MQEGESQRNSKEHSPVREQREKDPWGTGLAEATGLEVAGNHLLIVPSMFRKTGLGYCVRKRCTSTNVRDLYDLFLLLIETMWWSPKYSGLKGSPQQRISGVVI